MGGIRVLLVVGAIYGLIGVATLNAAIAAIYLTPALGMPRAIAWMVFSVAMALIGFYLLYRAMQSHRSDPEPETQPEPTEKPEIRVIKGGRT